MEEYSIKVGDSFSEGDLKRIKKKALKFADNFPQITEITLHEFIDHNSDPLLPEPQCREKYILVFRHDGTFDDVYQEGEFYEAAAASLAWEDLGRQIRYGECAIDIIGQDDPLPKQASKLINPWTLYVRNHKKEITEGKARIDNFFTRGKNDTYIPRKVTGQEIVGLFRLLDSEIFDILKAGLQAYTPGTEKRIVNLDSLPRKRRYSLEEIIYRERLEEGTWATGTVLGSRRSVPQRKARSEKEIVRDAQCKWETQPENLPIVPDGCYAFSFTLPTDDLKRKKAIEEALEFIFKADDIEDYHHFQGFISSKPSSTHTLQDQSKMSEETFTEQPPEPERVKAAQQSVNFFHRERGGTWHIGFEGEEIRPDHLDGFSYIAEILRQKPGESVSCIALARMLSSKGDKNIVSDDAAMNEGLYFDHRGTQFFYPQNGKDQCMSEYLNLEKRLSEIEERQEHERTPEEILEQAEIKEEISKLGVYLKEKKNIADPNAKKAQSNIRQRLDDAFDVIRKAGMKKLADYLKKNITTDRAYGFHYIGSLTWDIMIK